MNSSEKILIIRLSSIGDIIQCTALPRLLKKRFPGAEIHWVVRSDNQELLAHNPYVTRLFSFSRSAGLKGLLQLGRELARENYSHVYDAHNNVRSHILCWFLKPRHFLRRSKQRFKRFLLFAIKLNLFEPGFKAISSYNRPLEAWDVKDDLGGSELHLSSAAIKKVEALLAPALGSTLSSSHEPAPTERSWIAMAPGAAWPKKMWPLEHWQALVEKILRTTALHIVVLGGPQDQWMDQLVLDPERVLLLQGKLSLLESAAAVTFCQTLVAADTGLLHLAEALNKNVLGMVGPTPFGDTYRSGSRTLKTKLWCQPCSKDGRGLCYNFDYQKCMKLIRPEKVMHTLEELLL